MSDKGQDPALPGDPAYLVRRQTKSGLGGHVAEGDEARAVCDQIGDSADLALDVVNHGGLERVDAAGLLEVKRRAQYGSRLFLGRNDLVSLAPLHAVNHGVEAVAHRHFERYLV